jgi:ribosomal peptide maturation radical SAM protein 1
MAFRAKSPGRVLTELKHLLPPHPSTKVTMVDNIMPHSYFRDLLPRLGRELPGLHLFYEQKANLSLAQVIALREAGVAVIQPGIEALSSALLKRMDKGVSASQNIALLRYAQTVDLAVNWNLLYAFPGDQREDYEQTLELLPLLRHLHPPTGVFHLSIDRFSPYFVSPSRHGVSRVRPWEGYAAILPEGADVAKVAYHFEAEYASAGREHGRLIRRIEDEIGDWRRAWQSEGQRPALVVTPLSAEQFLLIDTRALPGTQEITFLTRPQTALVLAGARRQEIWDADAVWALERKLVVALDGGLVPLATGASAVLEEFEAEARDRVQKPARLALQVLSPLQACA